MNELITEAIKKFLLVFILTIILGLIPTVLINWFEFKWVLPVALVVGLVGFKEGLKGE